MVIFCIQRKGASNGSFHDGRRIVNPPFFFGSTSGKIEEGHPGLVPPRLKLTGCLYPIFYDRKDNIRMSHDGVDDLYKHFGAIQILN
ncbi:MAG TPA: hypothetical protein DHO02_02655, partial [Syntrophaceae bacterium]|nr:hypothetical protein [Syntrophaceae bacterium]